MNIQEVPLSEIKLEFKHDLPPRRAASLAVSVELLGVIRPVALTKDKKCIDGGALVTTLRARGDKTVQAVVIDADETGVLLARRFLNHLRPYSQAPGPECDRLWELLGEPKPAVVRAVSQVAPRKGRCYDCGTPTDRRLCPSCVAHKPPTKYKRHPGPCPECGAERVSSHSDALCEKCRRAHARAADARVRAKK